MLRLRPSPVLLPLVLFVLFASRAPAPDPAVVQAAGKDNSTWTFAVSGDSRNCGDFVMPAIAAKVKAESDVFYWHLGDFRWLTLADQDMEALEPAGSHFSHAEYQARAWDDFLIHQMAAFGSLPSFSAAAITRTSGP